MDNSEKLFGDNQFVSFSVNVEDFDVIVIFQMFTQFGDINVHAAGIEIIVVNPNGFQSEVTLQNLVSVLVKQSQKFTFLGSQFGLLVSASQNLFLGVKGVASQFQNSLIRRFLSLNAA